MFIIKGINYLIEDSKNFGDDMYIDIIDELAHSTDKTLADRTTRFDTKEEAEATAKRQIIGAFKSFVIEEAETVERTKTKGE